MSRNSTFARLKWGAALLLLMLLDILPMPILGLLLFYVLLFRPPWFKQAVMDIYHNAD